MKWGAAGLDLKYDASLYSFGVVGSALDALHGLSG